MKRKSLSILHIAHINGERYSGVSTVIPNYLKYQSKHATVALLNLADFIPDNSGAYQTFPCGGRGVRIESLPSPFNNPDIIVFHEVYRPAYIKLCNEALRRKIPYIITPHVSLTETAQRHKRLKKLVGNIILFSKFIGSASAIHYLSESEKEQSRHFSSIRSFVCNNGIELRGRRKTSFSNAGISLVYVGRLEIKIKGIDRILDAVNIIQDDMRKKNIHVTIRGFDEANNVGWIQKMIQKYGIGDLVILGGPVFGEDKIELILKHDYFIQLSRTEGQPLGIMEAMDIGMPCIVTSGTTFADAVHDNQLGYAVGDDPADTSSCILKLPASVQLRKSMSIQTSLYAQEHFSWHTTAANMLSQYRRVVNEYGNKVK